MTQTDLDGSFAFGVYLHDTDSYTFRTEKDGYESGEYSMSGFDCLLCGCGAIEISLVPTD